MHHQTGSLEEETEGFFKRMEKKRPIGTISLFVGILLGLPAVIDWIRGSSPKATIEINSVSNVFDVHRPLSELTIIFNNENLQQSGKALRIAIVVLKNTGTKNILQGDYDQNQPFGFRLINGQIVGDVRVLQATSSYLKNAINPRVLEGNIVEFSKTILEKDDAVSLEIVILQEKNAQFQLAALGKIAGQNEISISMAMPEDERPFWRVVFEGGAMVNWARFAISVFTTIALLVLVIWITELPANYRRKRTDKKIDAYLRRVAPNASPVTKQILRYALQENRETPSRILDTLKDPEFALLLKQRANHSNVPRNMTDDEKTRMQRDFARMRLSAILHGADTVPADAENALINLSEELKRAPFKD